MHFIAVFAVLLVGASAQMQQQCLCSQVNSCVASAKGTLMQCADRCQSHLTSMGASYPAARQCILAHQGQIEAAVSCSRASFGNVCANAPGQMVPKRFPETIQIAAFREITAMMARSGLTTQATALLSVARKAGGCMGKCAQSNSCSKLGCGLALPADNIIVANAKRCAIQAGFNTGTARAICSCLANAGIRQLAPLCGQIIIS